MENETTNFDTKAVKNTEHAWKYKMLTQYIFIIMTVIVSKCIMSINICFQAYVLGGKIWGDFQDVKICAAVCTNTSDHINCGL